MVTAVQAEASSWATTLGIDREYKQMQNKKGELVVCVTEGAKESRVRDKEGGHSMPPRVRYVSLQVLLPSS
jgi:hypothetical protein